MVKKNWSMPDQKPPFTDGGSSGRGGSGGAVTNWNSSETSPRLTRPFIDSLSASTLTPPRFFARPCCLSAAKLRSESPTFTLPSIWSVKTSENWLLTNSKRVLLAGRLLTGTTKVLRASEPIDTGPRRRRVRSSVILLP
jgi:hypothetical protein